MYNDPSIADAMATILPDDVYGYFPPYPTVVIVIVIVHMASNISSIAVIDIVSSPFNTSKLQEPSYLLMCIPSFLLLRSYCCFSTHTLQFSLAYVPSSRYGSI